MQKPQSKVSPTIRAINEIVDRSSLKMANGELAAPHVTSKIIALALDRLIKTPRSEWRDAPVRFAEKLNKDYLNSLPGNSFRDIFHGALAKNITLNLIDRYKDTDVQSLTDMLVKIKTAIETDDRNWQARKQSNRN